LATICAAEATTICALQAPPSGMVTADPVNHPNNHAPRRKVGQPSSVHDVTTISPSAVTPPPPPSLT
jgi:hypothetical protein